jgi:hypothetical protein
MRIAVHAALSRIDGKLNRNRCVFGGDTTGSQSASIALRGARKRARGIGQVGVEKRTWPGVVVL